ncbi:MAG: creatininase family protein [Thermoplasmata archaeon]|nr:creatininase family protein [Thermoplasmata archaeon]
MNIANLTWKEIASLPKDAIFFISVSPLEAHGPHLPTATDLEISKRIEEETMRLLSEKGVKCASLPSLPIGVCKSLEGFPGTISVSWKTLQDILFDIMVSLASYGFRYFMIISFHMDLMHVKAIHKAIKKAGKKGIVACEPLAPYYFRGELFEDIEGEIHADMKETSLALYLFPENVRDYKIEDVKIRFNLFNSLRKFKDLGAEEAYVGSPSKANVAYGQHLFKKIVEKCVEAAFKLRKGEKIELPDKLKIFLRI